MDSAGLPTQRFSEFWWLRFASSSDSPRQVESRDATGKALQKLQDRCPDTVSSGWWFGTMAFIFHNIWDLSNKNGDIYIYYILIGGLEAWNFMTFHSVEDFLIPSDELHHFSEG